MSIIGNAAARETLVTSTSYMAAIWTDLFQSMLAQGLELRWRLNGPGIGRDARIAFSGLLGRYLARAYLTEYEGVTVLVPLDVAKRRFRNTPYFIGKDPPGRGLEADWIGLDDKGLVIVEAKGTFDNGIKSWRTANSRPPILVTAIKQAKRTSVYGRRPLRKLPSKRWAIASRWGTDENRRDPTLLAWDCDDNKLGKDDYRMLAKTLLGADVGRVMRGLGHSEGRSRIYDDTPFELIPDSLQIRVGEHEMEPGFAALVGPFGIHALRRENTPFRIPRISDQKLKFAVVSLSTSYVLTAIQEQFWHQHEEPAYERFSSRVGLTVVWPRPGDYVEFR